MVSPSQPTKQTYRLKYTGSKDQQSFTRECAERDFWYHSFYFDNGFQQPGDYDIGQNVDASISNQNNKAESSFLHIQKQPLITREKGETSQKELKITKTNLETTQQKVQQL